tara:strand:+ start:8199 stop:9194 length:996 start_codon:yes stop_codon:yes gene_type:complete
MRKFLNRILVFAVPFSIIIIFIIYTDVFKIVGFQDYYSIQKVGLNREMITTKTFNHFREKEKFNSFIFGSSRSQAYKCENWESYLDSSAIPFHFDAAGEGIWGISKKIEYIDELGDSIKNALIILDLESLVSTSLRKGHLFISMPCVSKSSKIDYYSSFIKASIDLKFLVAYMDYSVFAIHRDYMGHLIKPNKYDDLVDKINCDMWYGADKQIDLDSLCYYNTLIKKGIFYKRRKERQLKHKISPLAIAQLNSIKTIFYKHNTSYKIVISPLYDQIPLEEEQVKTLEEVFGKENIYNFSGINQFTTPLYNFYETSHYRPHVANKIIDLIYK